MSTIELPELITCTSLLERSQGDLSKNVCKLDIRSEYWGGFRNLSNFVMETKSGRIIFLSNQPRHFETVQNAEIYLQVIHCN